MLFEDLYVKLCALLSKFYSSVVPRSGGLLQKKVSNGRLGRTRDTCYVTRGPGSRSDRNAKT